MRRLLAVGLFLLGGSAPAPEAPPTLAYELTPVVVGDTVTALDVALHFTGDARGSMTLDLPEKAMGEGDLWKRLSDFKVDGAKSSTPDPAHRVLTYNPGAAVTVHYTVHGAYAGEPDGRDGNPYKGAILAKGWFAGLGEPIFVTPHDGDLWPASFRWGALPSGWTVVSDLEHGAMGRAMNVDDIAESTILGGADVSLYKRPIAGGELRFAMRGKWPFSGDAMADYLARTLTAQRDFWGDDVKGPFLVTLFSLTGTGSSGGTGRTDAFALFGTLDTDQADMRRTIAHEHMHSWIPRRIGAMPDGDAERREYWLSEGFTDFYANRTLLKSGLWSLEDFVSDLNGRLADYDGSLLRNAPNARIEKEFWSNYAISQLPYRRGLLLAFLWDKRLRDMGKGNLDAVMFDARDAYAAAPETTKPDAVKNFLAAWRGVAGSNLDEDVRRYAEEGATIELPPDLFGTCAKVETIEIPVFDKGFDADKSATAGHFVGVDPNGPAYAAGLRDGMKRIARLGGREGDSRVVLSYRVADAEGREQVVSYKPEGHTKEQVQSVVLAPGMSAARRAECVSSMSGGGH